MMNVTKKRLSKIVKGATTNKGQTRKCIKKINKPQNKHANTYKQKKHFNLRVNTMRNFDN
jgi:hypothetical protein